MGIRLEIVAVGTAAIAAGAAVGVWQNSTDRVYEASSTLTIQPAPGSLIGAGARAESMVFLAHQYAAQVLARPSLQRAADSSGLGIDATTALHRTTIAVSPSDATVHVDTTGPSKSAAVSLNSAVVDVALRNAAQSQESLRAEQLAPLTAEIDQLRTSIQKEQRGSAQWLVDVQQYRQLTVSRAQQKAAPLDELQVLSPALARDKPVAPHPTRDGLLAFLVAAALLSQIVVFRQSRRRRAATPVDAYPAIPTADAVPGQSRLVTEPASAIRSLAENRNGSSRKASGGPLPT